MSSLSHQPEASSSWVLDRRLCYLRSSMKKARRSIVFQHCRKLPGTFTLNPNKYLFICALLVPLLFFINNIFIAFHHYIFASSLGLFGLLDSSGVVNHTLFFFLNINLTNFPQLILDLPRSCVYRSSLSTLPFFSSVLRSLRLILTTSRDVFVPRKLDGGMLS